ncbi:VWA domain-containing protein [Vibrio sp. JC009]|uniref:TadE/TadG family type IV pilus assembly protein n=1 Tax=Vibrio sp. JC009 TaxID=2912314 RepID=UPI0023B03370|nr:VWA domain-containing protein [Vibrio sp. JC009]WED24575.1 VWA domain-containing protein [Vibrio sp. JC009]
MLNKQKGVATIMLAILLPLMIIIFAIALRITQHSQANAKIKEAAEVASLALISEATGDNQPNVPLAVDIVDAFVKDNMDEIEVAVVPTNCKKGSDCLKASGELGPFIDYAVSASSKHKSWLAYSEVGLEPEFRVNGLSTSRKFAPLPIDIYLVVDFSASMMYQFSGGGRRMQEVYRTVEKLIEDLEKYNNFNKHKSRIALLGYNQVNIKYINRQRVRIDYVVDNNAAKTVKNMFKTKIPIPNWTLNSYQRKYVPLTFHDIPLGDNYSQVKAILGSALYTTGRTESWQGLIAAAQELNKQKKYNTRQAIIIISDGDDSPRESFQQRDSSTNISYFFPSLVSHGLCRKLENMAKSKEDREGNPVEYIIGVIGIDYIVDRTRNGMYDCVGAENIFHAKGKGEAYKHILKLLGEETGRLR